MSVALERVATDDVRLQRLLQLYLYEWSDRVSVPIGADALFEYPGLEQLEACLFLDVEGAVPVGFALTFEDELRRWHVEEMFVIAGARRRGVGRRAMQLVFEQRPGPWTLTVRPENPGGLSFWRRALAGLESGPVEERGERGVDGVVRTRFSFTTRSP